MYWLVGILIITVMMGVLAVASSIVLPVIPLLTALATFSSVPWWLITLATILVITTQLFITKDKLDSSFSISTSRTFSQNIYPKNSPDTLSFSLLISRILHYSLTTVLAVSLIVGSALQALSSHQQAEITKIDESMRVQALVTIEGVSDSVYDLATDSGYRQVAIISHISPLVSEMTTRELDEATVNHINSDYNSLSNKKLYGDDLNNGSLNSDKEKNVKYRVLLNAYPKISSKKPSKKASKASDKGTPSAAVNDLQPGDQLFMTLTLAPLATSQQAISNPSGFDSYRWLRARHIDGEATIIGMGNRSAKISASSIVMTSSDSYLKRFRTRIDQGRWQLRRHFYQEWSQQSTAQQQAKAVTLSLLTGDRSLINRDTKDLYQLAGISHLLAISGTHVLFLAIMLAGTAVLFLDRLYPLLYRYIPRWQVRWWVMISAAFIYALFTGFDVPAARTAWMLLAIGAVRFTLLPISSTRVLLALAVLMAWVDSYVLWQAGYWLSFIAVALLLKYDDTLSTQNKDNPTNRHQPKNKQKNGLLHTMLWPSFKRLFKLQFWLFIALLPITLLLFGKASLWGLVVNLFAIGLFGWVIVPLNLLAGLCYLLLPAVADSIWALVSTIIDSLHELLLWLTELPLLEFAWLYTPVNTAILLMSLLVLLPWLLPRGLISRWLMLPPLTLLAMTITANQQSLSLTPTLYVLPTGDRYISAAVLRYPSNDSETDVGNTAASNNDSVNWLFLADHRPHETRTMPSSLTADKLSATVEQQLRTLSIKHLEGIVVQTSSVALTETLAVKNEDNKQGWDTKAQPKKASSHSKVNNDNINISELLPMTVAQLSQRLPSKQYWQAGRSDQWAMRQKIYAEAKYSKNNPSKDKSTSNAYISAQRCEQGKIWQRANSDLILRAMTGWPKIADASVWDCIVAIDSRVPLRVVQYNAADPLKSPLLSADTTMLPINPLAINQQHSQLQKIQKEQVPKDRSIEQSQSRIILDAATHQRVWPLWSLLCEGKPFTINISDGSTRWLGHSASNIPAEMLVTQSISEVITYDDKPLEVALALMTNVDAKR